MHPLSSPPKSIVMCEIYSEHILTILMSAESLFNGGDILTIKLLYVWFDIFVCHTSYGAYFYLVA